MIPGMTICSAVQLRQSQSEEKWSGFTYFNASGDHFAKHQSKLKLRPRTLDTARREPARGTHSVRRPRWRGGEVCPGGAAQQGPGGPLPHGLAVGDIAGGGDGPDPQDAGGPPAGHDDAEGRTLIPNGATVFVLSKSSPLVNNH